MCLARLLVFGEGPLLSIGLVFRLPGEVGCGSDRRASLLTEQQEQ